MKKTVTLPDGTVEVLEGTPEEIAAHEKLIRERQEKRPKKPDVLKGAPIVPNALGVPGTNEPVKLDPEIIRKLQELVEATRENKPLTPWWPSYPNYDFRPLCWICGIRGCQQLHQDTWPSPSIIYTTTVTDNTLSLKDEVDSQQRFVPHIHGGLIVH